MSPLPIEEELEKSACRRLLEQLLVAFTSPILQILACTVFFFVAILLAPSLRLALLGYCVWIYVDQAPRRGGWPWWVVRRFRTLVLWKYVASYFPAQLVKTTDLDPSKPYLFGYHPHGIISCGALLNFGTDATSFSRKFPGVECHVLGAKPLFRVPFFREWMLAHGGGSCGRRTCERLLSAGRSVLLVVGGARESLAARPGEMKLTIKSRKGFCRVALRTGAALVPVISFGENELFDQLGEQPYLRWLQEQFLAYSGFTLPSFFGAGSLPINLHAGTGSLSYGLLPFRRPLRVVVGKPISPPKIGVGSDSNEDEVEMVDALHTKYLAALRELFEAHKDENTAPGMVFQ